MAKGTPTHPALAGLGKVTGKFNSRVQAKHLTCQPERSARFRSSFDVSLRSAGESDDMPEDVADSFVVESSVASQRSSAADDLCLTSGIQCRQPGDALHRADLFAERDTTREELNEIAIQRLD